MKKLLMLPCFLILSTFAHAKAVVVSSSTATAVLPTTFFGVKTIALYNPSNIPIYLNDGPIASTQAFVNDSFSVVAASGIIILPDMHGTFWAMAPTATSTATLLTLTGK